MLTLETVFAVANASFVPIVYFFFPETALKVSVVL